MLSQYSGAQLCESSHNFFPLLCSLYSNEICYNLLKFCDFLESERCKGPKNIKSQPNDITAEVAGVPHNLHCPGADILFHGDPLPPDRQQRCDGS